MANLKSIPVYLFLLIFFVGGATDAHAKVWISEFMASNDSGLKDSDGDHSDWIEIYNDANTAVNIGGWRLSDDSTNLSKWVFPSTVIPAKGFVVVFASNKDRRSAGGELHTNFKLSKSGEFLALIKPDNSVEHSYAPTYPEQFTDISYGLEQQVTPTIVIAQGATGRAGVPQSLADFNANYANWNSALGVTYSGSTWRSINSGVGYERNSGYGNWIGAGGNFETDMYNKNSSIFLRLPFNISDPTAIGNLSLRMRWDAGFVAYLNGVEVAADRKPASPTWNSSSTIDRPDGENDDWVTFNINLSNVTLNVGANLLAIHGLNDRIHSSDMLCLPELETQAVSAVSGQVKYFAGPTPNGFNSNGVTVLPPLLGDVTEAVTTLPQGGAGSQPITVTAKVTQTQNPISSVNLFYRVMYNGETQLTMLDNGVAPDAQAGDGIYTVNVPTTGMSSGQMIRWRIESNDNQSNKDKSPSYSDPLDSDQYYGTIANAAITTTNLPVLHWFVQSPSSANTRGGTRSSFFYNGQFYDNIQTDLHGQSTALFGKKSYDIDFNKGNRFEWKEGEIKAKDINLLTNWADKTKVRNTMAYEVFKKAGAAHHYAFPVRVQQNGAFFSVADMVEDGDERFLERIGFDPEGALYKMYNYIDNINGATKKTRKDEDKSDMQALINGLNESQSQNVRRLYGYDNIDIPETVNYLAGLVLAESQDQGHKNYYVYRDTNITGEWMPIVWDLDLSYGHNWSNTEGYFNDDFTWNDNLQIGISNRLKTLIWNSPELNAMFVRRVRTLMDEQLQSPTTPLAQLKLEQRITELSDLIDPIGVNSDADLDFTKWGSWQDGGGGSSNASHRMRSQTQRLFDQYLPNRRAYLYGGAPTSNGLGVPAEQQSLPSLVIGDIEFLPASGNQNEEYFVIKNQENTAVDISGWQIKGAVELTFKGGTVIPAGSGDAASQYIGALHVAKSSSAFRARNVGAKGGEYRFVVGQYKGQLSSRGETIELWDASGNLIASKAFSGTPSIAQQFLRVSEINYHPADPSAAESSQIAGLTESDFEYIELVNTGNNPLTLDGASFIEGINFVIPAGTTLAPGARIVIAKNVAAFTLRYGTGINVIGDFEGFLSNKGERIKLVDSMGESVLDFEYDDKWYPPTDGGNFTIVIRDPSVSHANFDQPESWGISSTENGSPAQADTAVQDHFEGWRHANFNSTEREDAQVGMLTSDPDNDGYDNWAEYCFGTDPKKTDQPSLSFVSALHNSQNFAAISVKRRKNAFDVNWSLQSCTDVASWVANAYEDHGAAQDLGSGTERAIMRSDKQLNTNDTKYFFRVRAVPK